MKIVCSAINKTCIKLHGNYVEKYEQCFPNDNLCYISYMILENLILAIISTEIKKWNYQKSKSTLLCPFFPVLSVVKIFTLQLNFLKLHNPYYPNKLYSSSRERERRKRPKEPVPGRSDRGSEKTNQTSGRNITYSDSFYEFA